MEQAAAQERLITPDVSELAESTDLIDCARRLPSYVGCGASTPHSTYQLLRKCP